MPPSRFCLMSGVKLPNFTFLSISILDLIMKSFSLYHYLTLQNKFNCFWQYFIKIIKATLPPAENPPIIILSFSKPSRAADTSDSLFSLHDSMKFYYVLIISFLDTPFWYNYISSGMVSLLADRE